MIFLSPDVTIGLQYSAYTVGESSGRVQVCALMSGTSDITSTVLLATVSGTAGNNNNNKWKNHFFKMKGDVGMV